MNALRPLAVVAIAVVALQAARAADADDVAVLASWWPGIYDTSEQLVLSRGGDAARAEGSELRVRTIVARIDVPWLGEHVLYTEEFLHDEPERLRRQVLLRLASNPGGGVRVRQYTLRSPLDFRHLHRSPRQIAGLRLDDLEAIAGCDLVLRREVTQFVGGTEGNACRDDALGEARYIDYRLLVGEDLYWYRKRRYFIAGNELEHEIAGFTWFPLYQARLFTCRVRWSSSGRRAELRDLHSIDLHDQGGRARVRTPDGRNLEVEMHAEDWPFAGGRDALILMLSEAGTHEPLATSWTRIDAEAITLALGWINLRCAVIAPDRPAVAS